VSLDLWPFFVKQQRLIGSYGRTRRDMMATLNWAARGKLRSVIDAVLPLSQAAEGFTRLRARRVLGKVVICPTRG
jgi:D-arabinose 1-dehydrogenase-like Zn-dependent alcohol dehydrogenase